MGNSRILRNDVVQSVDRAVSILQVLARRGPTGVSTLAAELSVHKSTVFRLLATLESRGLVEQSTARGGYQLGYGVVQLAAGTIRNHELVLVSRPVCQDLAETAGETVNVVVNDGHAVVSIDQVIGSSTVTTFNWVGRRGPMHVTSAGKVFLAHLSDQELTRALSVPLPRYTEQTVVDPQLLRQQLADVRYRGFACTSDEQESGLAAVAAPVKSLDGTVVAAIAVSGPTYRINARTIPYVAEHVVSAAAEISERNGYPKQG